MPARASNLLDELFEIKLPCCNILMWPSVSIVVRGNKGWRGPWSVAKSGKYKLKIFGITVWKQ